MSLAERKTLKLDHSESLAEIQELQDFFDSSLGIAKNQKILSYNPVLEYWTYKHLANKSDEPEFRLYEGKQLETALRERLDTSKSVVHYRIIDGKGYNENLPDEPFVVVLERGFEYRKKQGSVEQVRERSEINGWQKIFENLLNPDISNQSKFIVISGPGIADKTAYPYNFVDIYEKDTFLGETVIKMTRTSSEMTYENYAKRILVLDPHYFDNFTGPIDAWLLDHPIPIPEGQQPQTADDVFDSLFEKKLDALSEELFKEIFQICMPLVLNYINVLCQPDFNPKQIAIAFNAILNKADIVMKIFEQIENGEIPVNPLPQFRDIQHEAMYLGTRPVREVSGGCGVSAGFSIDSLLNSIAIFGAEDQFGLLSFACPDCGFINTRPFGQKLPACLNCTSTNVAC